MGDSYDGFMICPHCEERQPGPLPADKTTLYHFACPKCKNVFVVQDRVTHHFQSVIPAPFPIGHRFKRKDAIGPVYTAETIYLTECQGWWVHGVDGEVFTHTPCESTVPA